MKRIEMYHRLEKLIINGHIDNANATSMDIVSKSAKNISDEETDNFTLMEENHDYNTNQEE